SRYFIRLFFGILISYQQATLLKLRLSSSKLNIQLTVKIDFIKGETKKMDWKEITTIEEWDAIINKSNEKDQIILKHSTTCPVRTNALEEYDPDLRENSTDRSDYTMVKVRESRPVSNKIEADLSVKHDSPQIIYINDQMKYWSASHSSVTKALMEAVVNYLPFLTSVF